MNNRRGKKRDYRSLSASDLIFQDPHLSIDYFLSNRRSHRAGFLGVETGNSERSQVRVNVKCRSVRGRAFARENLSASLASISRALRRDRETRKRGCIVDKGEGTIFSLSCSPPLDYSSESRQDRGAPRPVQLLHGRCSERVLDFLVVAFFRRALLAMLRAMAVLL